MAVKSGLWPLYEVFDGERYRVNARPDGTDVMEYLKRQRRFAAAAANVESVKQAIAEKWAYLDVMAKQFPA